MIYVIFYELCAKNEPKQSLFHIACYIWEPEVTFELGVSFCQLITEIRVRASTLCRG